MDAGRTASDENPWLTIELSSCVNKTPLLTILSGESKMFSDQMRKRFATRFNPKRLFLLAVAVMVLALVVSLSMGTNLATAQSSQGPIWSTDAMACVPNGSTIQYNMVQTSHGHARYTEGKTGALYLICPFTDATRHGTAVSRIAMTFRNGGNGRVSAGLRMMDKRSGNVSDALTVRSPCLIDSTQLGNPYNTCQGSGTHRLDFNRYYYYVQLSLVRDRAADDVRVVGVSIW
jgi:hypothetical protein